jgi:CheY-like chemotaxis protein
MNTLILVVDDEPDIEPLFQQQFRRELRDGRFVMAFARSADEALARIESEIAHDIILVLSDVNMPGMNGLDLLATIKTKRPGIAVALVTAYGDAATARIARERGAEALYPKPIDFGALKADVGARIAARSAGASS